MQRILVAFLLVFLCAAGANAQQGSDDLKKKQAEIQHEIEDLRKSLNDTKKNKKASLGQLAMIKKKLALREQAIGNINAQINQIQSNISQNYNEIARLNKELDTLKEQYKKSIVYAYKNRSNYEFLNFIFSAPSFNEALKRIEYLKSYRQYREQQAATIKNTQTLLNEKNEGLKVSRKQKDEVLKSAEKEKTVLADERKEKDEFLGKIKEREREISKELELKARADIKLKAAIRAAIEKELKAAREKALAEERARAKAAAEERERERKKEEARLAEAKRVAAEKAANNQPVTTPPPAKETHTAAPPPPKKQPEPTKSVLEATPEGLAISGNFANAKGKLPWPVERGEVKLHFGPYRIEGLGSGPGVVGNNPGITIETTVGATVKSVFEGEVTSVFDIEGNWAVIIKHGKYFSVYSNLASTSVSKGQKVSTGQALGKASTNDDGNGEVEFIITLENTNQNPESWIRRK
ncbi:peptidoglycan DD-metalloendopeptidase family protein [Pseudoflavitalea sp. G-6-1-2]|uniref:murein hydrolase activator EnvC family protein n=1 Tax=Pseudoflavitalea sp. G-6-1-2 TaxID=2728841 RepID=UPI00146A8196|nr:peptidoglycan DD-metalloendopeptidase family protein [Pseudoflavitalea sp. G-6-1-2]NML19384.1 peptidoglycan DD-metalloendopeptidase family protein [Pseudoflavitalea sp. G-6-1-2]